MAAGTAATLYNFMCDSGLVFPFRAFLIVPHIQLSRRIFQSILLSQLRMNNLAVDKMSLTYKRKIIDMCYAGPLAVD